MFFITGRIWYQISLNVFEFCPISTTVIQNVNKAKVKVRAKKDNVAGSLAKSFLIKNPADFFCNCSPHHECHLCLFSGVTLPVFEHYQEGGDSKNPVLFMF